MESKSGPYAILVRRGTFDSYDFRGNEGTPNPHSLRREEALKVSHDAHTIALWWWGPLLFVSGGGGGCGL